MLLVIRIGFNRWPNFELDAMTMVFGPGHRRCLDDFDDNDIIIKKSIH